MAANLGQAFLGAGGITPSLAQELASSTFHEARESFHDYIYSKLILGDDKGPGVMNPNVPVFPNSNLANSYPTALPPSAVIYNHPLNNSGLTDGQLVGHKAFCNPSQNIMQVNNQKPANMKKKPQQPQSTSQGHLVPGNAESPTKVKKKSHHKKKEKTNVCDVCGRGFAEKYTLNRHMLTHTHVKPFSCSKCNMSFSRSDGLAKHMGAGHRRIDAHHCDVCGGTFNSEVSFEQHRREYGNTLPFVCNLCMLAFSQCCHLNYHMKSHSLSKMQDNFIASMQEDKNNAIDVSELIPEDFTPPKKKDSFSGLFFNVGKSSMKRNGDTSLGLMNPNIVIKPEIDDMPTCNQLTGASSSSLTSSLVFQALNTSGHLNMTTSSISSTAPSYLPDTSNAGTSGLNPISDAEMKKYFDIKIPNPKFLEGAELHPVGVGEDGLFRCEICGKGFTRKYHMQRHVKLHTRGPIPRAHLLDWTRRPYACGVCKMGFTRQHHLTRHMLIHTGERPHSCHVCGKAFRRYTNLSLHVRTVHGAERPFKCHICGRGFPRLYSLQRHLRLHAKNAALIALDNGEQLYKGFKPVGTLNADQLDANKSSTFNAANPDSTRQSPGQGRETSSDHSDEDGVKYDHNSSLNENQSNPDGHTSPRQELQDYNQNQGGNENFNPQQSSQLSGNQNSNGNNQGGGSQAGQGNGRLGSQNLRPPSHDQEMINRMSRHERSSSVQNTNYGPVMQPTNNNERFNPTNAIPNQNMRGMDLPVNMQNYNEMEMRRDANNYTINQRNNPDGFNIHQQRIQSPHAILTSLERPGSRSMINQPEGFHHNQANFNNQQQQQQVTLQAQQRVSMDLSSSRSTMSPAGMHGENVAYAHGHHLDLGGNRGGLSDPPAYPHPHAVGSIQFTNLYPHQLGDHLELHPNPTASPMPVNNHNNNIQY